MKEHTCQVVSKEQLIAYADGDLSPSEAERIAEHIANCQNCQSMAEALQRSLQVTKVIWQTSEVQWLKKRPPERFQSSKWSFKKVAAVAASILLVLGVGAVWRMLSRPSERLGVIGKEPTAIEIEVAANREALAAQMLAVADLLSTQPGGEQYAVKRYSDVITSFPETEQSAKARLHLRSLLERR